MDMKKVLLYGSMAALLASCSSSDSSNNGGSVPTNKFTINGKLVDPEIKDARVVLLNPAGQEVTMCGYTNPSSCTAITNSNGEFNFVLEKGVDLTNFTIKTYGGTDVVTGTSFLGVPLTANISNIDTNVNNSINVTPATTLIEERMSSKNEDRSTAEAAVARFIGIDVADINANPMDKIELAKATYIISTMFANGATAESISALDDGAINLFDSSTITLAFTASPDVAVKVNNIVSLVKSAPVSGDVSEYLTNISEDVKVIVFDSVVAASTTFKNYPVAPDMASDGYKANVKKIIKKIESEGDLKLEANTQMLSNVLDRLISANDLFGDYNNYINDATFEAALNAEVVANSSLMNAVKLLCDVKTVKYFVSSPLSAALTENAIFDYWLASDVSNVNKAVSYASETKDDALVDEIYRNAIEAYATYGKYELAEQYSDAFIKGTFERMKIYSTIGDIVVNDDKAKGVAYIDRSYESFVNAKDTYLNLGGSLLVDYLNTGVDILASYAAVGESAKSTAVRAFIGGLVPTIPTDDQYDIENTIYNTFSNKVKDLIEAARYDDAYSMIDALKVEVESNAGAGNSEATKALRYSEYIEKLNKLNAYYLGVGDTAKQTHVSANIDDIYAKFKLLPAEDQANHIRRIAVQIYSDRGKDALVQELKTVMSDPLPSVGVNNSDIQEFIREAIPPISSIAGWDETKLFLEEIAPVDETTANTIAHSVGAIANALVKYGSNKSHIGVAGTFVSSTDPVKQKIGKDALAYQLSLYEKYINHSEEAKRLPKDAATSYDYRTYGAGHVLNGNNNIAPIADRYKFSGALLGIATRYLEYKDNAAAINVLSVAEAYVDGATESFNKFNAYTYIASTYRLAGDVPKSEAAYEKAVNVIQLSGVTTGVITTDKNWSIYYVFLAADYINRGRNSDAVLSLDKAFEYLEKVSFKAEDYADVADHYYAAGDKVKATATLEHLAAKIKASSSGDSTKANDYRDDYISRYASYGMLDDAYSKVKVMFKDDTYQLNKAMSVISDKAANADAFTNTNIAISDMDKDGEPDFFLPFATEEQKTASGLVLDKDIDGDGKNNDVDLTPFHAD